VSNVTNTPVTAAGPWSTRGELLAARTQAIPQLESRLLSPRRLAVQVLLTLVVGLAGLMTTQALADGADATNVVIAVLFGAGALAAAVAVVRRALENRRLVAELLAWVAAERSSRGLPAGVIAPGVRAAFDARADADFEEVALAAFRHPHADPTNTRLLLRGLFTGLGLGVGFIFTLLAVTGEGMLPAVVPGGFVLVSSLVLGAAGMRWSYRFMKIGEQLSADLQTFRGERMGVPAAAQLARAEKRTRAVLLAPPALVFVVLLLVRLGTEDVPSWVVGVVVAVAAALSAVGVVMLRRLRSGVRTPGA
jgi:hypothetical protein